MINSAQKTNIGLSKSKILSYLQCPKRLWLEFYKPEKKDEDEADLKMKLYWGNRLNQIIYEQHEDAIFIGHQDNPSRAYIETKEVLDKDYPILFEPAFAYQNLLIRTDILVKNGGKYEVIEVKSSTRLKDYHKDDCAIQYFVLEKLGLPIKKITLAHVNRDFRYKGDGDYSELLTYQDLTEDVQKLKEKVKDWIEEAQEIVSNTQEIDVIPGSHCNSPFKCPFTSYCESYWKIEFPLWKLPYITKNPNFKYLLENNLLDVAKLPKDKAQKFLKKKQLLVWRCVVENKEHIDPGLKKELEEIFERFGKYPRFFLDFETVSFVVPEWEGTRPYQNIPFQFSCHIESAPGDLKHEEFLDFNRNDPRPKFLNALLKVLGNTNGPIFIYSNYETKILQDLAKAFPQYKDKIEKICHRLVDLCQILRKYYYHPKMNGSWSLKYVAPAIISDFSYDKLDVSHGSMATYLYLENFYGNLPEDEIEDTKNNLLEYCKTDTLVLAKILKYLENQIFG